MRHINKIGEDLEKRGFNTRAAELETMGLKALAQNDQNPEKAKGTLLKLMRDSPRVLEELFGGEDIVRNKGYQYLCGLKRRHDEATEAARREEARAGRSAIAAKASDPVPASPRRNDGDGGHSMIASNGHARRAASPSPYGDGKGQSTDASQGRGPGAHPSPPLGDDRGHDHLVGNDRPQRALSSPPLTTAGAGQASRADQGQTSIARPAVAKPSSIPVKREQVPAYGQKNESAAAIAAKMRAAERRGELLTPTWKVFDGRDLGEVLDTDLADINKRSVAATRLQTEKTGRMVIETMTQLVIEARIGAPQGKRVDERISREEMNAAKNRMEMMASGAIDAAIDDFTDSLRKVGQADAALPLFQESMKLIGGTANAA